MSKKPRTFSPQEKAQVALVAIKGEKTISQISSDFQVHSTQIGLWKKQALENFSELFKVIIKITMTPEEQFAQNVCEMLQEIRQQGQIERNRNTSRKMA